MRSTAIRHSVSERLATGSGAWQAAHGPVKMRRPSFKVAAALPIAGVTLGAMLSKDAQPPSARTSASAASSASSERRGTLDERLDPGLHELGLLDRRHVRPRGHHQ